MVIFWTFVDWWLTFDESNIYFGICDYPLVLNTVSILCNVVMMTVWGGENPGRTLSDRWSFVRIDTFSWREICNLHFTTIIFSDFAKTQSKVHEILLLHISYKLYIFLISKFHLVFIFSQTYKLFTRVLLRFFFLVEI